MANGVAGLAYQLSVDSGEFSGGLGSASKQVDQFSGQVAQSSQKMEQSFQSSGSAASGIASGFSSSGLSGAFSAATGAAQGLASTVVGMAGPIGVMVSGFVIGLLAIANEALKTTSAVNDINKLARSIGGSAPEVAVLQKVFEQAGFSIEDSRSILLRFSDKLGDLKDNIAGPVGLALEKIGLDPEKIAGLDTTAAFERITTALSRVDDATVRNSASQAIFSRAFVDLDPIVSKGAAAFDRARNSSSLYDKDMLKLAASTMKIKKEMASDWDQIWGKVSKGFTTFFLVIGNGLVKLVSKLVEGLATVLRFLGALEEKDKNPKKSANQGDGAQAGDLARRKEASKVEADASKLAAQWADESLGLTTRQLAIRKAERAGASAAHIAELKHQDEVLNAIERRKKLAAEIDALVKGTLTSTDKFYATINLIGQAANLSGQQRANILSQQFREMERSLGGSGSLNNDGLAAGSIEAARRLNDLETRRRNGADDPANRVVQVLEAIRQLQERALEENRNIGRALANVPGLGVAPIEGNP